MSREKGTKKKKQKKIKPVKKPNFFRLWAIFLLAVLTPSFLLPYFLLRQKGQEILKNRQTICTQLINEATDAAVQRALADRDGDVQKSDHWLNRLQGAFAKLAWYDQDVYAVYYRNADKQYETPKDITIALHVKEMEGEPNTNDSTWNTSYYFCDNALEAVSYANGIRRPEEISVWDILKDIRKYGHDPLAKKYWTQKNVPSFFTFRNNFNKEKHSFWVDGIAVRMNYPMQVLGRRYSTSLENAFIPGNMMPYDFLSDDQYIDCEYQFPYTFTRDGEIFGSLTDKQEFIFSSSSSALEQYQILEQYSDSNLVAGVFEGFLFVGNPNLSEKDCTKWISSADERDSTALYTGEYTAVIQSAEMRIEWSDERIGYMLEHGEWPDRNCPWTIGYYIREDIPFWELMPFTTQVAFGAATVFTLIVSLILAALRYQRAKSVWVNFEYRRQTTAAMAHDLKTPLATISAYAECLEENITSMSEASEEDDKDEIHKKKKEEEDTNVEYARKIRENVTELNNMLETILNLSRNDSRVGKIDLTDVHVGRLIKESLKRYERLFEERKLTIRIKDVTEDACILRADEGMMQQVVWNLLSNSAKYAEEGTEVEIYLDEKNLIIRNKTKETIENVDELRKPFVKGNAARGANGTGLGLSIVDSNLKALGYKMDLDYYSGIFEVKVTFK